MWAENNPSKFGRFLKCHKLGARKWAYFARKWANFARNRHDGGFMTVGQ